jgi:cell division septation protein DedD
MQIVSLKHRILGVFVMVALTAIFAGYFFQYIDENNLFVWSIPTPPATPEIIAVPKISPVNFQSLPTASALSPSVWSIQVGSFSSTLAADNVMQQLRAEGFPTYQQVQSTNNIPKTLVFVGPEINADTVKALQKKLLKENNLTSTVEPFWVFGESAL